MSSHLDMLPEGSSKITYYDDVGKSLFKLWKASLMITRAAFYDAARRVDGDALL